MRNTLRTYGELHDKFDMFLSGQMESNMLFVARWGIGKSFYIMVCKITITKRTVGCPVTTTQALE